MRRLANGTQVPVMPAIAAALGTPGFGTDGNPEGGQEASIFGAAEFNMIQETIARFIEDAGLTLDGANLSQLTSALAALMPGMYPAGRSLTNPGQFQLSGGLIVQWCNNITAASNSAGEGTVIWTFPSVFSSQILGASFCATNLTVLTNTQRAVLGSLSLANAVIYCGGGVPSQPSGVGISGIIIGK